MSTCSPSACSRTRTKPLPLDGPWPALPFVLGVRNGTNARAFRTWSGLTAAEATIHVKSHLLAVLTWYTSQKQEALKRKVLKLRDEISENIVVIASCKTMQCLRTDTRRELGSGTQTHQTPLLTSHMQPPTPPPFPSFHREELLLVQQAQPLGHTYLYLSCPGNWVGERTPTMRPEILRLIERDRCGSSRPLWHSIC